MVLYVSSIINRGMLHLSHYLSAVSSTIIYRRIFTWKLPLKTIGMFYNSILVVSVKYPTLKFVIELCCPNYRSSRMKLKQNGIKALKNEFHYQSGTTACFFVVSTTPRRAAWHESDILWHTLNSPVKRMLIELFELQTKQTASLSRHSDMSLHVLGPVPWLKPSFQV